MPRIDALPDDSELLKQMLVGERAEHESVVNRLAEQVERIKNEAADRLAEQAERLRQEAAERLEALRQQMEAEKKAAGLPPKLTVPMMVFFLPCIFVVLLTPAIIQIMQQTKRADLLALRRTGRRLRPCG